MLRNGGSGAACSLHELQFDARSLALAQPPANAGAPPTNASQHTPVAATPFTPIASQRGFRGRLLPTFSPIHRPPAGEGTTTPPAPPRTTAAVPSTPCASQRGFRGPAACAVAIQPALRCRDHERASRNQHPATSNALPLRAVEYALPIRTSAEQPARQAPLHPSLSRCLLPLAPRRTAHRFATTNARRETNASRTTTPPDRFVRARLRCSSRASLPLTPQAGTPTATIGMRPATSLRTKTKSVN
jgi:hypothetical protein